MANDNNNLKELVSDDDQTSELDVPTLRNFADDDRPGTNTFDLEPNDSPDPDSDVSIEDLMVDLRSRTETIERLQFDIERLRSMRRGLETEIRAREAQTGRLTEQARSLATDLRQARQSNSELCQQLESMQKNHERELRTLRFELGEAEETAAQYELITEQLTSDLVDTRGFKVELERMLTASEQQNQSRIAELDKEVARLKDVTADYERDLAAKSGAINCLLEDLSSDSRQAGASGELKAVIHEIDGHLSARTDGRPVMDRDRVTRLLIGDIDGQELRFPLFKHRLTIGRMQENDIQIEAPYVSRRHAVIVTEGNMTRVVDWGSRNGVYVNSSRVTEHFLVSGDIVTIGTADFRYEERPKRDA